MVCNIQNYNAIYATLISTFNTQTQSLYMYECVCIYISTINNLSCGQTTVKNLRHSISTNDFFNVESCDATLNGKNFSVKLVFLLIKFFFINNKDNSNSL